ncbi:DinB family protein [Brevibacillus ginsengisoli]|uniref:DinB family protein n=1 Tax=Brevibacillus ginsengisoli TaxID=363854 RepID=UPI003CF2C8D0
MTTPIKMYDYHVWANQTMLNYLKELPPDTYKQEVQSVFPSISKAMAHIYMVDTLWIEVLCGKSLTEAFPLSNQVKEAAESASIEELQAMFDDLSKKYQAFFSQEPDIERKVILDNPYTRKRVTSLAEMLMQVVNHGTYHRGNVSAMLRQLGHASTMTEYALFWYQDDAEEC